MICVYDIGNEDYEKNGDAVLMPVSGKIRMAAGGSYDLSLECPMDEYGKWKHLMAEAIIKAPVPKETITTAYTGMEADVYVTTEAAALRSGASEPTAISYPAWSQNTAYQVGSKVSSGGHNYQCNYWDGTSPQSIIPPYASSWWARIADRTDGSPLLVNMASGTELYYVSGPEDGWYKMCTTYGIEGYVKSSQVEYEKHMEPGEIQPRVITTQLFRIRTVTVNSENQTVSVNARHVSYDLNGVLVDSVNIVRKGPAETLAFMQQGFMISYAGIIATDMASSEDVYYSGEISGKNGMYCLLDPDKGVVSAFDAEFRRDNWDLFVLNKTETDRGFRILYGNNMKGITWKESTDNLVTRIVPVAKDEDGNDLYLDPVKWVDSEDINSWPVIYMERMKVNGQVGKDDGTETDTTWTAETLREEMAAEAQQMFDVDQCDKALEEITIDFVMLGETVEYAWMKDLESILLYDTVIAVNERTGISVSMTVSEIEYDIVKEKVTGAKVKNIKHYAVKNVAGMNVLDNTITAEKLTDDIGEDLMDNAVDESEEYTRSAISSYDVNLKKWLKDRGIE